MAERSRSATKAPWIKLALLAGVIIVAVVVARSGGLLRYRDLPTLAAAVRAARTLPHVVPLFIVLYAVVASVGLPAVALTLAGGALFGAGLGTLLNWIGATLGATGAYALARVLGRDAVRGLIGQRASLVDRFAEDHGFGTIFRLRLIPVVPFNALNFAAGLAGVRAPDYVLATGIGIVPGTAVYTYFADALLGGVEGAREQALVRVALAGGLLLLLSFAPTIARKLGWLPHAAVLIVAAASARPL